MLSNMRMPNSRLLQRYPVFQEGILVQLAKPAALLGCAAMIWKSGFEFRALVPTGPYMVLRKVRRTLKGPVQGKKPQSVKTAHFSGGV